MATSIQSYPGQTFLDWSKKCESVQTAEAEAQGQTFLEWSNGCESVQTAEKEADVKELQQYESEPDVAGNLRVGVLESVLGLRANRQTLSSRERKVEVARVGSKDRGRGYAGKKTYVCKRCGNSYGKNSHLNIHELVHTGIRKFLCT